MIDFKDMVSELRFVLVTQAIPTISEYKVGELEKFLTKILTDDIILVDRKKLESKLINREEETVRTILISKGIHIATDRVFEKQSYVRIPKEEKELIDEMLTNDFIHGFRRILGYSEEEQK